MVTWVVHLEVTFTTAKDRPILWRIILVTHTILRWETLGHKWKEAHSGFLAVAVVMNMVLEAEADVAVVVAEEEEEEEEVVDSSGVLFV